MCYIFGQYHHQSINQSINPGDSTSQFQVHRSIAFPHVNLYSHLYHSITDSKVELPHVNKVTFITKSQTAPTVVGA